MSHSNKILLVDNSPFFLNILNEAISAKSGFEADIVTASSRQEALACLNDQSEWLVVVSGYELPDARGGEFIQDTLAYNLPVIVLTSALTESEREKALSLNIVDYFPKDTNCFADVATLINQLRDNHEHKILIVDDSPAFSTFAKRLLLSQNYQVLGCDSAEKAMDIIRQDSSITLTLIDYILPDMDGSQLIPRLRKFRDANSLPVIAISAFNEKNIAARMIKAGASDFLLKPVDHEELLLRIRNSLKLQDQFQQAERARDDALKANQAKSQFLARISHELRTPLNAIMGFSQLLSGDENLESDQLECLSEIEHASSHLLHLINEVLDLSHIESGKVQIALGVVKVLDVIQEAGRMLAGQAESHQVRLILPESEDGDSDKLMTDSYRLKQILINLISNGVKYNVPDGRLEVQLRKTEEFFIFVVKDTGQGIAADQLDTLFEPFTRAHSDRGRVEGNGLGLSISKRLAEMLGGSLSVESTLGEGSQFFLTLPRELSDHLQISGQV